MLSYLRLQLHFIFLLSKFVDITSRLLSRYRLDELMLTIHKSQMATFQTHALACFEQQMVGHALKFAPRHAKSLSDQQLQLCVHTAVSRSREQGLTLRGPVRLWVELTFMFGTYFDTDPQLLEFVDILNHPLPSAHTAQLSYANNLRTRAVGFAERIAGNDSGLEQAAFERVRDLSLDDLSIQPEAKMIELLEHIHPEKVNAAGVLALQQIIKKARSLAETHAPDDPAGPMAITLLMFSFGHGCVTDLLFPWIAESLSHPKLNARARLERIRRKALRFILAGFEGG